MMNEAKKKASGSKNYTAISVDTDLRKQLKIEIAKRELNSYSDILREECSFLE
jgi:hypothetical protein